ncbi:N-acetyl-gamma-glutamyl-phosphate reductase [Flavobacteriaceae bacterium]|jgi:N-acetyl-gamma-glutamyl-phosphate reductase|nr:N-acetyl-gamma-glutamyl-phosphate reductase [Flavobacteriaceae bacterium]MDG1383952.1 N-acetyl-gamma-glutamyl-phosphate reductase [Flavobacteriaceae bacterium]
MIQAGIIGGAGYTAGELIRLLLVHSKVEINFVFSTSSAGKKLSAIHQDLVGSTDQVFTDTIHTDVDILFLCLGHGNSKAFLEKTTFSSATKIIDLSNDFRLSQDAVFQGKHFVYGLPELNTTAIQSAQYIANPGCFATAIQLAILPLAANGLVKDAIHVNAVTGATGAGTALSATTHFTWRVDNFSHYKAFNHQHLGEIHQSVDALQENLKSVIHFIPNRGNFSRGIFATLYTKYNGTLDDAKTLFKTYYKDAEFTIISDDNIHLKQVVNTNKCLLQLEVHDGKLLITSVIDNLLKGASGQAVHNMNLMYGFEAHLGLQLKANYF